MSTLIILPLILHTLNKDVHMHMQFMHMHKHDNTQLQSATTKTFKQPLLLLELVRFLRGNYDTNLQLFFHGFVACLITVLQTLIYLMMSHFRVLTEFNVLMFHCTVCTKYNNIVGYWHWRSEHWRQRAMQKAVTPIPLQES